jgi:UrcA family protein
MTTATSKLTALRRSLTLAGTIVALGVATTSFAAPASEVLSVTVRYDDLNLATEAGVSALYSRISHAAREVCPDVSSRNLGVAAAGGRCQAEAVARAVRQLKNPALASLHASRVSHG